MKLLAIDTSTSRASIALHVADNQIFSTCIDDIRTHAEVILPSIEKILVQGQVKLMTLDGIVFGSGPGSFTGLRVACSIAKALAYAHDLPLYSVGSLAAIAQTVRAESSVMTLPILSMIDARMQQVYWSFSEQPHEKYVDTPSDITLLGSGPIVLAGIGYEPYLAALPAATQVRIVSHHTVYPDALAMIQLVLQGKITAVDALSAEPEYVRNHVTQGGNRG